MADSKVSDLALEATTTSASDWMYIASFNGTTWDSKKIKPDNVGGKNFANANLTLTANRSHDGDSNRMTMAKFKDFTFETFVAPTIGLASLNFNGYGTSASDETHAFSSDNGMTAKMYGDNSARFYGNLGVNGMSPTAGYGVYSTGATAGFRGEGYYGVLGVGSGAGIFGSSTLGIGVYGSSDAVAVRGDSATGIALFGNGESYVEENGLGAGMHASSIFQINSTIRGFLPPRMTTTEINAITSPAEGLVVYNTTLSHLCFKDPSGWRKISHSAM